MISLRDLATSPSARRVREDAGAVWDQLLAAADQAARRMGTVTRHRGRLARRRAATAALALRGDLPSRWRWWAAGLATGAVAGVAGTVVVSRRLRSADGAADADAPPASAADTRPGGAQPPGPPVSGDESRPHAGPAG